jgi:hypothetical protein
MGKAAARFWPTHHTDPSTRPPASVGMTFIAVGLVANQKCDEPQSGERELAWSR